MDHFSIKQTFSQTQANVKNYSSIQVQDLNSGPLRNEFYRITTEPGPDRIKISHRKFYAVIFNHFD